MAFNIISGRSLLAMCCLYNPSGVLPNYINFLCHVTDFVNPNHENTFC